VVGVGSGVCGQGCVLPSVCCSTTLVKLGRSLGVKASKSGSRREEVGEIVREEAVASGMSLGYAQWVREKNSDGGPPVFTPSTTAPAPLTAEQLPQVPAHVPALLVRGLLSRAECQSILGAVPWEGKGYMSLEDVKARYRGRVSHRYLSYDPRLATTIFERLRPLLPATLDGGVLAEVSPEWRVLKYEAGGVFSPHVDGREPGEPEERRMEGEVRFLQSRLTIQMYLNDHGQDFDGGEFVVFKHGARHERSFTLAPRSGDCVVFYQEKLRQRDHYLLHSAEPVVRGERYAMRTMVQYAFRSREEASSGGAAELPQLPQSVCGDPADDTRTVSLREGLK